MELPKGPVKNDEATQSEQKCTLQTRCNTLLIHLMNEVKEHDDRK